MKKSFLIVLFCTVFSGFYELMASEKKTVALQIIHTPREKEQDIIDMQEMRRKTVGGFLVQFESSSHQAGQSLGFCKKPIALKKIQLCGLEACKKDQSEALNNIRKRQTFTSSCSPHFYTASPQTVAESPTTLTKSVTSTSGLVVITPKMIHLPIVRK